MNKAPVYKYFRISLFLVTLVFFSVSGCIASETQNIEPPLFIAHAGGAIDKQTYTNSLEALIANYDKGFRFFEIDLSWTSDDELVAIHDWDASLRGNFIVSDESGPPTKTEFLKLEMKTGLTQLSLEDVLRWAKKKGDVFIVTDVKEENIRALRKINADFKEYRGYVLPQVYNYQEYTEISELGYPRIILTLYKMKIDSFEVMSFSERHNPFAVTMPWQVAQSGLAYALYQKNTIVYAHTVNDLNQFHSLREIGVFGIYTDHISPP